jgi:hypothetical protein
MLTDAEHEELFELQRTWVTHRNDARYHELHTKSHVPPDGWTGAEAFFYEHAGWGYDPKVETPEEGRQRSARALAAAEAWAKSVDLRFVWEYDEDAAMDAATSGEEFETCEWAAAYPASAFDDNRDMGFGAPRGIPLASLGGITNADANYRRVIQAELASEARGVVERAEAHAKLVAPILEDLKAARARLDAIIGGYVGETESMPDRFAYCNALSFLSNQVHGIYNKFRASP